MDIFQKPYDWLHSRRTPIWLKEFLLYVQVKVLIPTLKEMGEAVLNDVRRLVIKASQTDWTNEKKFTYVFDEIRTEWPAEKIKESTLNLLIEFTVVELKSKGLLG